MIHTFRSEMKKWRNILWVILISMVASLLASMFFSRQPTTKSSQIGYIQPTGTPLYVFEFMYQLQLVQAQRSFYMQFARKNPLFAQMPILATPPSELALSSLFEQKVIDAQVQEQRLELDPALFYGRLAGELPHHLFDEQGVIKEQEYRMAINQYYGVDVADFELMKRSEQLRAILQGAIENSVQVAPADIVQAHMFEAGKKQFSIATFTHAPFVKKIMQAGVDSATIEAFYDAHSESYREPEKRIFDYWAVSLKPYEEQVSVSDEQIDRFYRKNVDTMFRIPPQVKVRHIRLADASQAEALRQQLQESSDQFGALAKQHSSAPSAAQGGLIDFFERGTFDADFERSAFALSKESPLSEVVTTKEGFEIILFLDRKAASSKPLSKVKYEIVDAIKTRGATEMRDAEIKRVRQQAASDSAALISFAEKHNLPINSTSWLAATDANDFSRGGVIATRAFELGRTHGVVEFHGYYMLYRERERIDSHVPSLSKLAEQVKKDYINDRAQTELKQAVKEGRRAVIDGTKSLEALAQELGGSMYQTGLIEKKAGLKKELPEGSKLLDRAFLLRSQNGQVAKKRFDDGYHLAQLVAFEQPNQDDLREAAPRLAQQELERLKRHYYSVFVASLQRHATLTTNDNFRDILNSIKHIDER